MAKDILFLPYLFCVTGTLRSNFLLHKKRSDLFQSKRKKRLKKKEGLMKKFMVAHW